MLQAILFDLDGTLLPMDNDHFTRVYFQLLAETARDWGYTDPDQMVRTIWAGVEAMVRNDGARSNYDAFWQVFGQCYGQDKLADIPKFSRFYDGPFRRAVSAASPTPLARTAVSLAHRKAEHVILATNPVFPHNADLVRLEWLGLGESDFDLITDYENCSRSKPNPNYYRDILARFDLEPSQCLMIGNDVSEDFEAARAVGIPVYLVTDFLINRKDAPFDCPSGSYGDMIAYLQSL